MGGGSGGSGTAASNGDSEHPSGATTRHAVEDPRTWRGRFAYAFRTHAYHLSVLTLVLVDMFCVVTDIAIELLHCPHPPARLEHMVEVLSYISVAVLCVFIIEFSIIAWAIGPRYFTRSLLHATDVIVVVVSLVGELVLRHGPTKQPHGAGELIGLLVVLRLWRLARIVHASTELVFISREEKHHARKVWIRVLESFVIIQAWTLHTAAANFRRRAAAVEKQRQLRPPSLPPPGAAAAGGRGQGGGRRPAAAAGTTTEVHLDV